MNNEERAPQNIINNWERLSELSKKKNKTEEEQEDWRDRLAIQNSFSGEWKMKREIRESIVIISIVCLVLSLIYWTLGASASFIITNWILTTTIYLVLKIGLEKKKWNN